MGLRGSLTPDPFITAESVLSSSSITSVLNEQAAEATYMKTLFPLNQDKTV